MGSIGDTHTSASPPASSPAISTTRPFSSPPPASAAASMLWKPVVRRFGVVICAVAEGPTAFWFQLSPGPNSALPPRRHRPSSLFHCRRPHQTTMAPDSDSIADCVLEAFDKLPEKRKPRPRSPGAREWVPLAGIVLSKGNRSLAHACSYTCLCS